MAEQVANISESDKATAFEKAERQRNAWDGISVFVKRNSGLVISPPGPRIRFQCYPANTKLVEGLERIGFKPIFLGKKERLTDRGIFHVYEYEIILPA